MGCIITLTSDFGLSDHFVAAMKGVILGVAPDATLVDISHGVPPQSIVAGALALEAAAPCFPQGTVHLAVVDPGVGSERAAIAVEGERYLYVAPDNGLLSLALNTDPLRHAVKLTNPHYQRQPVSATFHGRDIFAPAAAHLAAGVPLGALGEPLASLCRLELSTPREVEGGLEAHVIHVDRFGNLVTDLTAPRFEVWRVGVPGRIMVRAGDAVIPSISRTYSDVAPGAPVAYFGSGGRLEIGVRNGSAAAGLGLGTGGIARLGVRGEV